LNDCRASKQARAEDVVKQEVGFAAPNNDDEDGGGNDDDGTEGTGTGRNARFASRRMWTGTPDADALPSASRSSRSSFPSFESAITCDDDSGGGGDAVAAFDAVPVPTYKDAN
jgi:hypothetical protein